MRTTIAHMRTQIAQISHERKHAHAHAHTMRTPVHSQCARPCTPHAVPAEAHCHKFPGNN
eukprot:10243561-Alexandrium_andersonii.AAC.1